MTTFKRIASAMVFVLGLACAAAAQNPTAALQDRNASGTHLAEAVFALLAQTGSPTGVVGTTLAQNVASHALVRSFLEGDDGTWSLIATVTFNPPRDLPAGAACIRPN